MTSKLPDQISLPKPRNDFERQLFRVLGDYLNLNSQIVTGLQTGKQATNINAQSSMPTTGIFARGDFVPRDPPTPTSAGTTNLHIGWLCINEGSASAGSLVPYIVASTDAIITEPPGTGSITASVSSLFLALQNGNTYITQDFDDYIVEDAPSADGVLLALINGDTYETQSADDYVTS